ncbi:MAG: hypothetical protein FRX49_04603 [Trebouxia sp. A1-2]|nr:MAG: hypothetical protein FRX49_04603 [Trebouxia sp. A1-2]
MCPSGGQRSHDQIKLLQRKRLNAGKSNISQDMCLRLVTNQSRYNARIVAGGRGAGFVWGRQLPGRIQQIYLKEEEEQDVKPLSMPCS